MSALFSFLGGSIFRMIWGEVSTFVTKKQDHAHELGMLKLQAELDDKRHTRDLESIRLQAELQVKQVTVKAAGDVSVAEAEAFTAAMQNAFKPTGILPVDIWNGIIRPAAASLAMFLWMLALYEQGWRMGDWDRELVGVILGFFFANRVMHNRGK